jgi:opacity protein-like surface antigen
LRCAAGLSLIARFFSPLDMGQLSARSCEVGSYIYFAFISKGEDFMRKILFIAGLFLLASIPAKAQIAPHVEVFGGYSYMRFSPSDGGANLNGWNFSVNFKPTRIIGIVADFDGTSGSPEGFDTSVKTYLVGPQFTLPGPISPFVHVMFGGAHLNISGSTDTSFATAIGGGIDFHVAPHISVRPVQFDEVFTRFNNGTQNDERLSLGVVVHF